ncbi:TetR/AcrR family transcriptional regulator [Microbacterium aureliae]
MGETRTYTQTARAATTAATRTAIIDATIAAAHELLTLEITLDQIAARSGVSVQTILRHFGSKDALFAEVGTAASARVVEDRRVTPGDVAGAVRAVVEHYEQWGELMVRLVAAELSDPRVRDVTDAGRATHRRWVEDSFGPLLTGDRDAAVDLLAVATDLQVWSLLRRDRGLSPALVQTRMRALVDAILESS